jgi:fibronectin type 3 domain-containing protein
MKLRILASVLILGVVVGCSNNSNLTGSLASLGSTNGASSAPNPPASLHSASIAWNASTSAVSGYYVYRGTQNNGPYNKLNSAPQSALAYTDSTVQAGATYYYVTTAVNSANVESVYSNQISVTIP